jgi:hypothetical protein
LLLTTAAVQWQCSFSVRVSVNRKTTAAAAAAAAAADTMKTNVPFQAPGSNRAPRGAAQEQGTTAVRVLKNAGKQIK